MSRKPNKHKKPLKTEPKLNVELNEEQKLVDKAVEEYDVVFVEGIWGSGKTLAAVASAVIQFRKKRFNEILVTRPFIKDSLGALPGGVEDKLALDMQPIMDNIHRVQGIEQTERMKEAGEIKVQYNGKVKGNTFSEAICVCDESQDLTIDEMIEMITRLGKDSKIIFTVSKEQIHKRVGNKSSYHKFSKLKESGIVGWVELKENHRNPIIQEITDYLDITDGTRKKTRALGSVSVETEEEGLRTVKEAS